MLSETKLLNEALGLLAQARSYTSNDLSGLALTRAIDAFITEVRHVRAEVAKEQEDSRQMELFV